ncbi:MAG TPA: nitroreductase family deazaflavin-dependent oxidoreductase [Egibacteraceae bacterium]
MAQTQQTTRAAAGRPGRVSRWLQHRANARTITRIRRKGGRAMGMDLLILHTRGRRSGQPRETPLAWFRDDEGGWLVVASGGGDRDPDWYANLEAHPDRVAVELHGAGPVPVRAQRLEGDERERAWQRIAAAQPRIAKYQRKHERVYPVLRLTPQRPMETR